MKFVGNATSKIAHAQGCKLIKKIGRGNRVNFASKAAARKKHFKLHKVCASKK